MNNFIRQLTHSNELFEKQWSDTCTRLDQASTSVGTKAILDALVDYVLVEPCDPPPNQIKLIFIEKVTKQLATKDSTITLDDVVTAFTRVLDAYATNGLHVHFLKAIYQEFHLCESLYSIPPKTHLIELIFKSLQKKKEAMMDMLIVYQDLYRYD